MNGTPYTMAEDDAIRAGYLADGAQVVADRLGRTAVSLMHRARRIGVLSHRRWTAEDDRRLRVHWGQETVEALSARIGRTPATTYWRAQKLGLDLGCQQGMEYLTSAAVRCGFSTAQLRRILGRAGVQLRAAMSRPSGAARGYQVVDSFDVDEAVAAWLKTETLESAGQRVGFSAEALRRMLLASGEELPPLPRAKKHWRVPIETVDRVVARWFATESVEQAARRLRMRPHRLRRWLARVGYKADCSRGWRLPRETADAAAARAALARNGRPAVVTA
jgi:hypothetical protein